jgi:hypothetical protein
MTPALIVHIGAGNIGRFEVGAFFVATGAAAASLVFGFQAMKSPAGLFGGAPPPAILHLCGRRSARRRPGPQGDFLPRDRNYSEGG